MKTKAFYLTTKVMVVVVLVLVLAIKVFAGSTPKVSLIPYSAERALISIENLSEATEMLIEDAEGNVVYFREGSIKDDFYSKKFDFKNLEEGNYRIVVKNAVGEYVLPFKVAENKIVVMKNNNNEMVPYFEVKDGVLKLSLLNHNNEEVEMNFANDEGVFFSKKLGNDFSITAGFNLGNLNDGEYTVKLKRGEETFSYNFAK